jgi:hypothetical protein
MRRFIAIGVGIFLVFMLLIVLIANRGDRPEQAAGINRETELVNYAATDATVRYTLGGRINARENHRVLQITVGQNERTATIFDGYQGKVLKQDTYLNDVDAFRAFLAALQNNGYTKPRIASRDVNPIGACASGKRYNYDILNSGEVKQSLWSTSCGNTKGTFAGNASNVQNLFEAQVPDYDAFIKGVTF